MRFALVTVAVATLTVAETGAVETAPRSAPQNPSQATAEAAVSPLARENAPSTAQPTATSPSAASHKILPIPGEMFTVAGRPAFIITPAAGFTSPQPWVWYAPTLPGLPDQEERWLFTELTKAGIAIAGIDVGESYGSPAGRALFTALHDELTRARGFATRPVLLGRSRGGLMALAWASEHPERVAAFAGIYPVCNLASYPGLAKAAGAYGLTAEQLGSELATHNPVDRLAPLAARRVPLFAIHGDSDTLVPLELNSALLQQRYRALGGSMELVVPAGQGHNRWTGFFQSRALLEFVLTHATAKPASSSAP